MKALIFIIPAALLLVSSCSKRRECSETSLAECISTNLSFKQTDPEYIDFRKHKVLWDCWDVDHYLLTMIDRFPICFGTKVTVEVKGGEVVEATASPESIYGCTTEMYNPLGYKTIDDIFYKIESALDNDIELKELNDDIKRYRADQVRLKYDSIYGFPTHVHLDYLLGWADEEDTYEIISVEILD